MPPHSAEYFSLNDPHQLTHIDLMFDLMRDLMRTTEGVCVSMCVCVYLNVCARAWVGKCERLCFWTCWFGCTCISAYVYFSVYVCVGEWVFGCMCVRLCLCVYVYACVLPTHSLSLSMLWYLQYSSPSFCEKVQAGPRETCWESFLGILSTQTCSVVSSERKRFPIFCLLFLAEAAPILQAVCCMLLGEHFSILCCIASGRDRTSWAITAHPSSHTC